MIQETLLDETYNEENSFSTVKDQRVDLSLDVRSNVHIDAIIFSFVTNESGEVYMYVIGKHRYIWKITPARATAFNN